MLHDQLHRSQPRRGTQTWPRRGPHIGLDVVPKHSLDVPPKHSLDVAPKYGLDVALKHGLDVAPKHSLDVAPKHSLDVAPKHSLYVAPTTTVIIFINKTSSYAYNPSPKTMVIFVFTKRQDSAPRNRRGVGRQTKNLMDLLWNDVNLTPIKISSPSLNETEKKKLR